MIFEAADAHWSMLIMISGGRCTFSSRDFDSDLVTLVDRSSFDVNSEPLDEISLERAGKEMLS